MVCDPYSEITLSLIVVWTWPLVTTMLPRSPTCLNQPHHITQLRYTNYNNQQLSKLYLHHHNCQFKPINVKPCGVSRVFW